HRRPQSGRQSARYDPATNKAEAEPIQQVWVNHNRDLVDVRLLAAKSATTAAAQQAQAGSAAPHRQHRDTTREDNGDRDAHAASASASETIHTTANHPWLTVDRGWVPAGDLKPGERVVTLDSQSNSVVEWVHAVPGQTDMYNLTVANDHTYA